MRAESRTARARVAAGAAAAVVSAAVPVAGGDADPGGSGSAVVVRTEAELSGYTDSDHVTIVTPAATATVEDVTQGWSVSGGYLADIVSAASVDIVSTATPVWKEVRHSGTLGVAYQPRDIRGSLTGSASLEPDHRSLTLGGIGSIDLDEKNLTPIVGYAFSRDTAGRTGTPFSVYALELDRHTLNVALQSLVDRSTTFSVVGDLIVEDGEQSKPYRYVPMFAPDVAPRVPRGASIGKVNELRLPERPIERLPTSRWRYAVTVGVAQRLSASTYRLTQRLYADSWGLEASTTEAYYLFDVGSRLFVGPHGRGHLQTGVGFWRRAYSAHFSDGGPWRLPAFRTGDRELGPLGAVALGGLGRWYLGRRPLSSAWNVSLTLEGAYTAFFDALFVESRIAGFTSVAVGTAFE